MLRIALIACVAAAGRRQPSSPRPGSEASSASSGPATGPATGSTTGSATGSGPRPAPHVVSTEPCDHSECGPPMGMPNHKCPDGSIGGPTGQCLRNPDGSCGWEVRKCP